MEKSPPGWLSAEVPMFLARKGVTKSSVMPGMEIMVEGYLAKDGSNKANAGIVSFLDGKKLFLGSSNSGAAGGQEK